MSKQSHREYPCPLSESGACRHGGSKAYNYGFMRGNAGYCRYHKEWTSKMTTCPLRQKEEADDQRREATREVR